MYEVLMRQHGNEVRHGAFPSVELAREAALTLSQRPGTEILGIIDEGKKTSMVMTPEQIREGFGSLAGEDLRSEAKRAWIELGNEIAMVFRHIPEGSLVVDLPIFQDKMDAHVREFLSSVQAFREQLRAAE